MGNDGRDAEAALAFRGILNIHVREPTTPLWQSFKQKVREKMNASPFYIQLDESEQVRSNGLFHPFLKCIKLNLHPSITTPFYVRLMAKSIKTRALIAAFVRMTSKNRIDANNKEVNLCSVYHQVEVYAGAIYDAIYLYANALNETLAAGGSKRDGRAIVKRMLNREFEGKANIEHA